MPLLMCFPVSAHQVGYGGVSVCVFVYLCVCVCPGLYEDYRSLGGHRTRIQMMY